MKNIYLLPTDKPSRLAILNSGKLNLGARFISSSNSKAQHIYITSNEEVRGGDYVIEDIGGTVYGPIDRESIIENPKKIILTTDPDLISEGVHAIDDEFLEWFVKNPSCEYVEVEIKPMFPMYSTFIESIDNPPFYGNLERRIIIPQEEPKKYPIGGYAPGFYYCTCVTCKEKFQGDKRAVQCEPCAIKTINIKEEPEQETLEEATERILEENYAYNDDSGDRVYYDTQVKQCIIDGTKWQKNNYVKYISQLENHSFVGWSEDSINGYLTACATLKFNL